MLTIRAGDTALVAFRTGEGVCPLGECRREIAPKIRGSMVCLLPTGDAEKGYVCKACKLRHVRSEESNAVPSHADADGPPAANSVCVAQVYGRVRSAGVYGGARELDIPVLSYCGRPAVSPMAPNFYERIAAYGTPIDKRMYAPQEDELLSRSLRKTLDFKRGMGPRVCATCETVLQAANARADTEARAGPLAFLANAATAAANAASSAVFGAVQGGAQQGAAGDVGPADGDTGGTSALIFGHSRRPVSAGMRVRRGPPNFSASLAAVSAESLPVGRALMTAIAGATSSPPRPVPNSAGTVKCVYTAEANIERDAEQLLQLPPHLYRMGQYQNPHNFGALTGTTEPDGVRECGLDLKYRDVRYILDPGWPMLFARATIFGKASSIIPCRCPAPHPPTVNFFCRGVGQQYGLQLLVPRLWCMYGQRYGRSAEDSHWLFAR